MIKQLFLNILLFAGIGDCYALTSQEVYNKIMARKNLPKYKEGAPWNSKNFYRNTVWYHNCKPGIHTGIECYSFVMDMLEYASDYKYEIKRIDGSYKNLPKLHVGDGVRLLCNTYASVCGLATCRNGFIKPI